MGTGWFRVLATVLISDRLTAEYARHDRTVRAQYRQIDPLVGERARALREALAAGDVFSRSLAQGLEAPIASLAWHEVLGREGKLDTVALRASLQAISGGAARRSALL